MQWQQKSFHSTLACITATNTLHSVIFALCCVLHVLQSYTVVMLHSILLIISLDTRINACAHKANTFTNICMYIYVKKYISTSMYILYKCLYVFSPEYVMFLARRWQSSLQLIHCEHHSLNLPAGVKRKKHVQLLSHLPTSPSPDLPLILNSSLSFSFRLCRLTGILHAKVPAGMCVCMLLVM